jgi:hypothetical protein
MIKELITIGALITLIGIAMGQYEADPWGSQRWNNYGYNDGWY